jgi:hypothetical protein
VYVTEKVSRAILFMEVFLCGEVGLRCWGEENVVSKNDGWETPQLSLMRYNGLRAGGLPLTNKVSMANRHQTTPFVQPGTNRRQKYHFAESIIKKENFFYESRNAISEKNINY